MHPHTSAWFCPKCGRQNQSGFLFCPQCGTSLPNELVSPRSIMPARSNGLPNKSFGKVMAGLLGFAVVLWIIAINNAPPNKLPTKLDSLSPSLIEPSQSPIIETSQPKSGRKSKAALPKPTPLAKNEEAFPLKPPYVAPSASPTNKASGFITGPRGGCYFINGNGNKSYVDRSLCGSSYTYSSRSTSSGRSYITGPRGGCYYINGNGNKTYVDHSFCR